ncbi:MAG: hypothetical protein CMD18_02040 [Flavobacteriales bacterium]|nr:hypothetical protein [Flavobacteriales bacterium]
MKTFITFLASMASLYSIAQNTITATLDNENTYSINPMIYGYNQDHSTPDSDENWGSRRLGGNRMSVFNWENGASNSGKDVATFTNDNRIPSLVGTTWNARNDVGEAYRKFHQDNLDAGVESIITVPIMGWAAADKDGANSTTPPSSRWIYVQPYKTEPFSLTPNLTDDSIFVDESIHWLVNEFGNASTSTGIKYISLDNEPGLWSSTHTNSFPNTISLQDYVSKVIETAKAIKAVDPNIKLIAGEFTGIRIIKFKDASDWDSEIIGYTDFPSYFLDKLKQASISEGIDLIDYISFHYYPQHKVDSQNNYNSGGVVIRHSTSSENYVRRERMDLARSLWDENYLEPSWLTSANLDNEPHNILNRVQSAIDTYFPGVEIMIGEWDFGHDMDISHGISTVDALGVFAQSRVQIANRWNTSSGNPGNYTTPAYKLLRNYDGVLSTYGDICIPTSFSNKNKASVWASKSSIGNKIHLLLLNKDLSKTNNYEIKLGEENYTVESVWGFDENSSLSEIKGFTSNVSADSLYFSVPSLSAYHVVLSPDNITGIHSTFSSEIKLTQLNKNQYTLSQDVNWKLFDLKGRLLQENFGKLIDLKLMNTGVYIINSENKSWKIVK